MPSFDGQLLFGLAVSFVTLPNTPAVQRNSFFGVDGVESLGGGTRGYTTTVTGLRFGTAAADLAAIEQLGREYANGRSYTLIDTSGTVWEQVQCMAFEPQGRVRSDPQGIGYSRAYSARFEHSLSPSAPADQGGSDE